VAEKRNAKKITKTWGNNYPDRHDKTFWQKWHRTKVLGNVFDGDSFRVTKKNLKKKPSSIRMADHHAPELRDIGGCTVIEIRPSIPNYHRVVCRVKKHGIEVNKILSRTRITAKRNDSHLCPTKPQPKATWKKM
jgi:hypothetical protein